MTNAQISDAMATFRTSKRDAIKAAKELGYGNDVVSKLDKVTYELGGIGALNRIMHDARMNY